MGIRDNFKVDRNKINAQVKAYKESRVYKPSNYSTYFELQNMDQFLWKATEKGTPYSVDVIPFVVSGDYPFPDKMLGAAGAPKPGTPWFGLDLHIHQNIGPNNERVVCPKHSFKNGIAKGEKAGCPICEDLQRRQEKLRDNKPERIKIWSKLKYMRRNLYNVIVRDAGEEEDKGVQLYEVAHMYFQDQVDVLTEDDDDGIPTWWDIDEGKTVYFKVFSQGDDQPPDIKVVKLKDRDYEISDEELEESVSPQQWIKYYSYDELYEMYHQKPLVVDEPEDKDDEEEDDPPPHRERRKRQEKSRNSEVSDEDNGGIDDDDIPFDNTKDDQRSNGCPFGHIFGVEAGEHEECNDDEKCPVDQYKACVGMTARKNDEKKETRKKRNK